MGKAEGGVSAPRFGQLNRSMHPTGDARECVHTQLQGASLICLLIHLLRNSDMGQQERGRGMDQGLIRLPSWKRPEGGRFWKDFIGQGGELGVCAENNSMNDNQQ